jgi:hypothetical protein
VRFEDHGDAQAHFCLFSDLKENIGARLDM